MIKEIITITGDNQWTEWVQLPALSQLLIAGIVNSTVTFQGRPDSESGPYDIATFTTETFKTIATAHTDWQFRAGIKFGGYGSDTIVLRLEG